MGHENPNGKTTERSWARILPRVALALGFLVIACGLGWDRLVPERLFWGEADAQEYAAAGEAAHAESVTGDTKAALQRYDVARQKLLRAQKSHQQGGRRLVAIGAVLATVGFIGSRMNL